MLFPIVLHSYFVSFLLLFFYCCSKPLNQYFVKTAFVFDLFSWASQLTQTQWQSSLTIKLSDLSCIHRSLCTCLYVYMYTSSTHFTLQYGNDDVLVYFYFADFDGLKFAYIEHCSKMCFYWNSNFSLCNANKNNKNNKTPVYNTHANISCCCCC